MYATLCMYVCVLAEQTYLYVCTKCTYICRASSHDIFWPTLHLIDQIINICVIGKQVSFIPYHKQYRMSVSYKWKSVRVHMCMYTFYLHLLYCAVDVYLGMNCTKNFAISLDCFIRIYSLQPYCSISRV